MPPHPSLAARRRRTRRAGTGGLLTIVALVAVLVAIVGTGGTPDTADASQSAAYGTFECAQPNHDWTEIAGGPNSYVTGNCRSPRDPKNGPKTTFDRVRNSTEGQTGPDGWQIGRIGGSYDGCGVVKANESTLKTAGGPRSYCRQEPSQKRRGYVWRTSCKPNASCSWDPDYHGDRGTKLAKASCPAYANVRPFSDRPTPTDRIGDLTAETQKVYPFWMRYVTTKKPDKITGKKKRYALGYLGNQNPDRDVRYGRNGKTAYSAAGGANPQWVFVDYDCIRKPRHLQGAGKDRPGV